MTELTVGSLFSGIGGLDLGLERAGMRVIWQSEIDPYACRVLAKHWPEVPNHGNIKEINWAAVERPDILCGGYPCQPFSTAGKRKGEADPRHLWPWVRTAISELRPRYAILENVRGHLSMGGLTVIGELASIGYDAEWRIVSAASVGANHRRDRVIIVAYPDGGRVERSRAEQQATGASRGCQNVAHADNPRSGTSRSGVDGYRSKEVKGRQDESQPRACGCCADVADTHSKRQQKSLCEGTGVFTISDAWRSSPELGSICEWWETEPDVGRVADGVSSRVDRLRGLGNAVVPQVAEVIGRLVVAHAEAA